MNVDFSKNELDALAGALSCYIREHKQMAADLGSFNPDAQADADDVAWLEQLLAKVNLAGANHA